MIILTIRTDSPEAELGLYENDKQLAYKTWTAHRELGRTIHTELSSLLQAAGKELAEVQSIVAFTGPGSFTGLRIGLTVANTLAYSYNLAIVGSQDDGWIAAGIGRLQQGEDTKVVLPVYGAEANITLPRK
jgi:tRNA threonylcarbamoyladenosine biosynthesis protein TsaB